MPRELGTCLPRLRHSLTQHPNGHSRLEIQFRGFLLMILRLEVNCNGGQAS